MTSEKRYGNFATLDAGAVFFIQQQEKPHMKTLLKIISKVLTLTGLGLLLLGFTSIDGGAVLSDSTTFSGFFLAIFGGLMAVGLANDWTGWSVDVPHA